MIRNFNDLFFAMTVYAEKHKRAIPTEQTVLWLVSIQAAHDVLDSGYAELAEMLRAGTAPITVDYVNDWIRTKCYANFADPTLAPIVNFDMMIAHFYGDSRSLGSRLC